MADDYQNAEYPIIVENISKRYFLAHNEKPELSSIKDAIVDAAKKPLRLADSHYGKRRESFYALDDVSFKVPRGQVLAVMGKNGSGKSTLFKILARVTSPTSGQATITGRVGSLLEVGAGFHPELTGRENMFFNGSILGMKKSEIIENYDSILKFAEMHKFIDTPVKFYSSGMKVRLAFSIAVHLQTDILLLDEVLAVGDYDFRMKCFAKMEELAKSGKTILFVSHLPAHIRRICTHGILLKEGQLIFAGDVEETITEYLDNIQEAAGDDEDGSGPAKTSKQQPAEKVEITNAHVDVSIKDDKPHLAITIGLKNIADEPVDNIRTRADLIDKNLNRLAVFSSTIRKGDEPLSLAPGETATTTFTVPKTTLAAGAYNLNLRVQQDSGDEKMLFHQLKEAASFSIPEYKKANYKKDRISQTHGPIIFGFKHATTKDAANPDAETTEA